MELQQKSVFTLTWSLHFTKLQSDVVLLRTDVGFYYLDDDRLFIETLIQRSGSQVSHQSAGIGITWASSLTWQRLNQELRLNRPLPAVSALFKVSVTFFTLWSFIILTRQTSWTNRVQTVFIFVFIWSVSNTFSKKSLFLNLMLAPDSLWPWTTLYQTDPGFILTAYKVKGATFSLNIFVSFFLLNYTCYFYYS